MKASFQLHGAGMRYGSAAVLRDVSLTFHPGELTSLVGPNGAGKSTLLGIMAGLRHGYDGRCSYAGREVREWPRKAFTREVSFLPQSVPIEFPFTAEQVVLMGRMPHATGLFETEEDHAAVRRALETTDSAPFSKRDFRTLSGGEKQRVLLAAALAQSPNALLLDEPTTFLDLSHQVGLYVLLRNLCRQGLLVVTITHDLNLAARYSDRLVLLREGKAVADGKPENVLSPDRIQEVFHVPSELLMDAQGRPWIRYGQ